MIFGLPNATWDRIVEAGAESGSDIADETLAFIIAHLRDHQEDRRSFIDALTRPRGQLQLRALDLFCGGGGASRGLHDAGFQVTGVDVDRRVEKYYPYTFVKADVTGLDPDWVAEFDFVWASPPCQRWTNEAMQAGSADSHPDLIDPTRNLLQRAGRPYCMENVILTPMRPDLLLCGTMFGLGVQRHRQFECSGFVVHQPEHPEHGPEYFTVTGNTGRGRKGTLQERRKAMGIDWLPNTLLKEAVPPAYARYIGEAAIRGLSVPTR